MDVAAQTDAAAAIRAADAELSRHMAKLGTLRRELAAMRLPIPAAYDRLDHLDDVLAIAGSQLSRAADVIGAELAIIEAAEEEEYRRALQDAPDEDEAANDNASRAGAVA